MSVTCNTLGGQNSSEGAVPTQPTNEQPTSQLSNELEHGAIQTVSANIDERIEFTFPVTAETKSVKCMIGGGTGDAVSIHVC